jgi:hypothetical protein
MSPLPLLSTTASVAVVLAFVATLAPLASRKATCAAAVLGPVLAWMAWRLFDVIAPLGATSESRDLVESLDLWLLAVASVLGLAAIGCVLRVGLVLVVRARRHGPEGYPAR